MALLFVAATGSLYSAPGLATVMGWSIAIYFIAFIAGTIATALCLIVVGLPVAVVSRRYMTRPIGPAISFAGAAIACCSIALIFGNAMAAITVLPFALPAAYFYRSEILLEDSLR